MSDDIALGTFYAHDVGHSQKCPFCAGFIGHTLGQPCAIAAREAPFSP